MEIVEIKYFPALENNIKFLVLSVQEYVKMILKGEYCVVDIDSTTSNTADLFTLKVIVQYSKMFSL